MLRVLSLGAGVQSTTLLLMSLRGELPRLDAAVFADTQWEPKTVYTHLEWLKEECKRGGIPLYVGTAGNLRKDAIDFRRMRRSEDVPSSTGRRHASIPVFVKNTDGSKGRVRRQCTKEYKIQIVDRIIRREILGLAPKARAPRTPTVEHWFGISTDEAQRASYPGRFVKKKVGTQQLIDGDGKPIWGKVWRPIPWEVHAYPLLDVSLWSDRTSRILGYLPRTMQRSDCREWLARNYPDRTIPRSACIGCPFRSNEEWRRMRDEQPDEWADAVSFDREQRQADRDGQDRRGLMVGETYLHSQLVPLDMADLGGDGEREGTGCGFLGDGQDGLCGV